MRTQTDISYWMRDYLIDQGGSLLYVNKRLPDIMRRRAPMVTPDHVLPEPKQTSLSMPDWFEDEAIELYHTHGTEFKSFPTFVRACIEYDMSLAPLAGGRLTTLETA